MNFASDGNGGTLITDPPPAAALNAQGTISFSGSSPTDTYNESVTPQGADDGGTFTLEPVRASEGSASVAFEFSLAHDQFNFTPGETLTQSYDVNVTDAQHPAANAHQTLAVSIAGPGNDNFTFHPGVGAETISNFNPQVDTIELHEFAHAKTMQQLASLITTDIHGDPVIELGHNDSITIPGITQSFLQTHLQSLVHLH